MINEKIKDRLNKLYNLFSHENTPEDEKNAAKYRLDLLMEKHGITDYSSFLDNARKESNWINFALESLTPFSKSIVLTVSDYLSDTVIFNGLKVLCTNEKTETYIQKIITRYNEHVKNMHTLLKKRSDKDDYSNGYRHGVYFFFQELREEEKENSENDDSLSLVNVSSALAMLEKENLEAVGENETDMPKIKNQKIFFIGLGHGKNWKAEYLKK